MSGWDVRRGYSDEFMQDAVALCRASDRSSVKVIADRIGVNHETLQQWQPRWKS